MTRRQHPRLFHLDPQDADPDYRAIRNTDREPVTTFRADCERLWDEYCSFAHPNFVNQFARQFHQRWFEMYLTVALKAAGLSVSCPRAGPDVLIEMGARRIWVEATAPTGGTDANPDAVRYPVYEGRPIAYWVPRPSIPLRITQAFADKSRKFAEYLRDGVVGPDDACVIAINVSQVPHAGSDAEEYFMAALYGRGDPYVSMDRQSGEVIDSGIAYRPQLQRKHGAPVNARVFLDDENHRHVSAVLGSRSHVANRPERLGDDFILFPNTNPRSTLPNALIRLGMEFRVAEQRGQQWRLERTSHLLDSKA